MLGDSKSAPDTQTWGHILARSLSDETGEPWRAIELGRGGYTVGKVKENLTTNIDATQYSASIMDMALSACEVPTLSEWYYLSRCQASLRGIHPTLILIALGTNDVGYVPPWQTPNATTWKADYRSIRNTLHAAFPAAMIGFTKPWKRQPGGDETIFDTLAGYIDDLAAEESYTFALDDERIWLAPNASVYSADSPDASTAIHFNTPAGQLAAAAAKLSAIP